MVMYLFACLLNTTLYIFMIFSQGWIIMQRYIFSSFYTTLYDVNFPSFLTDLIPSFLRELKIKKPFVER